MSLLQDAISQAHECGVSLDDQQLVKLAEAIAIERVGEAILQLAKGYGEWPLNSVKEQPAIERRTCG